MAAYTRVTRADLKNRLSERVGNNLVFWTDPEKGFAVNEAIRLWGATTGVWNTVQVVPVIPGTTIYTVPKQIVSLQRVKYSTALLDQWSLFDLDNGVSGWQDATGTPLVWAPIGLNLVAVYPSPTVGVLSFEGIQAAPYLQADGDFIDVGDEDLSHILDYAHFYLAFKEGGDEFASSQPLFASFMEAASSRNSRLLASGLFKRYIGMVRDEAQRRSRVESAVEVR